MVYSWFSRKYWHSSSAKYSFDVALSKAGWRRESLPEHRNMNMVSLYQHDRVFYHSSNMNTLKSMYGVMQEVLTAKELVVDMNRISCLDLKTRMQRRLCVIKM